jgi:hypothetical protein
MTSPKGADPAPMPVVIKKPTPAVPGDNLPPQQNIEKVHPKNPNASVDTYGYL